MKNLIKILLLLVISFLTSCKPREKQIQKSEAQSEYQSESTARIKEKTFEIVFDNSIFTRDFSYKNLSEENSRQEKKNVDKGKEYYENGNLKKEWERNLSEQSEYTKKSQTELQEKLTKSEEASKYWEESTDHFYKALEQEKKKTRNYEMQLKTKESFAWQLFVVGLLIGWIILPGLFRWIWSIIKRFQPYIYFVEFLKRKR